MQSWLKYTRTEKDNTSRRGRREGEEAIPTCIYLADLYLYLPMYVGYASDVITV